MKKILLLAGNTLRSKAYAQQLSRIKDIEVIGLLYGFNTRISNNAFLNIETETFFKNNDIFIPDFSETIETTFEKNNWKYKLINVEDVNAIEILSEIENIDKDLVIFSGYGGQILKNSHFISKTPYLHMHPGFLPLERGSTTIYYSILNKRKCTVTAFFMTADLDKGINILKKQYNIPTKLVCIDKYYDNCVRADCMNSAIEILKNKLNFTDSLDTELIDEEYYVIHPILKHIAILYSEK